MSNQMLQERAIVVSLNICQWSARKKDKKISDEVAQQHNAKGEVGNYNKILAAKDQLKEIQQISTEARTYHYEKTLPWGEQGERLLPSDIYFEYSETIAKYENRFFNAVRDFVENYPSVIEDAERRLNGMFEANDYPPQSEIQRKFKFKSTMLPLAEAADFRIDLGEDEVNKLKEKVETEFKFRMTEAVKDTWSRIKDQLQHMKDKLGEKDAIFRDSLFSNVQDLINLLPKLNVTNDPNIEAVIEEMKGLIVSPDVVRGNTILRERKAEEVDKILQKFDGFFN